MNTRKSLLLEKLIANYFATASATESGICVGKRLSFRNGRKES